jgi:hypothetical protein
MEVKPAALLAHHQKMALGKGFDRWRKSPRRAHSEENRPHIEFCHYNLHEYFLRLMRASSTALQSNHTLASIALDVSGKYSTLTQITAIFVTTVHHGDSSGCIFASNVTNTLIKACCGIESQKAVKGKEMRAERSTICRGFEREIMLHEHTVHQKEGFSRISQRKKKGQTRPTKRKCFEACTGVQRKLPNHQ